MTDLSKIPDLELRQKVKELADAIDKIDARIEEMTAPFYAERNILRDQQNEILGERTIEGWCDTTGLPIFEDDDVVETRTLGYLEAA